MRAGLLLAAALLAMPAGHGLAGERSPRPGDRIRIWTKPPDPARLTGSLMLLDSAQVRLRVGTAPRELALERVAKLEMRVGPGAHRGAVVGAIVGGIIGLVRADRDARRPHSGFGFVPYLGIGYMVGLGTAGAIAGAIVGDQFTRWKDVPLGPSP